MIILQDGTTIDVSAYPLPDGVVDETMNRGQLADALNTSEVTVSKWITEGMPVLTEGGNGRAYEFQLSECYAWRMHRLQQSQLQRARADEAAAQMRLHFQNLDEDQQEAEGSLTPKQVMEASEADYRRNRAAELRGELVRTDRVRDLFEKILTAARQNVMTLPDFAEQEFGLSPHQALQMQERCEDLLVEMRNEFTRFIAATGGREPVTFQAPVQEDML